MKESMLQKDFRERDVQRMRNLITKKFDDKTVTQVGYTKVQEEHKEGDIWEENGKTFTIKNNIKVTLSKLDSVKKLLQMPLTCSQCGKAMKKGNLDKKMWSVHKICFDCVIEMETKLKIEGKYEEYQKTFTKGTVTSYIKDLEDAFQDFKNQSSTDIVTEEGDVESWKGGTDMAYLLKEFQEHINKLKEIDI